MIVLFCVYICDHVGVNASCRASGYIIHMLAVWLSGNALASINVVALRQTETQLVPGWVTICGRVNHLGM